MGGEISGSEKWRTKEEDEVFSGEARNKVAFIEMSNRVGELGELPLGETIKQGGVILDFGCLSGEVGALIAKHGDCALYQADVYDARVVNSDFPFIKVERNSPPDFEELVGKVDTVLLIDVLHGIIYTDLDPLQSKLELLKRLKQTLTPDGKIIVVGTSGAGSRIYDPMYDSNMSIVEEVTAAEDLRDKVLFYK